MNDSPGGKTPLRAIIAGHGDFATGLISAVEQITGRGNVFYPVSARNLSASDLDDLLRDAIDKTGVDVVFTDLQAGSCTMATRRICRDRPGVMIVAGVNLPMLLDFVFADTIPAVDAAKHAIERGRTAITAVGGTPKGVGGVGGVKK